MYANFELASGIAILTIIGAGAISGILSGVGFIYLYLIFKNTDSNSSMNTVVNTNIQSQPKVNVPKAESVILQPNSFTTIDEYLNSLNQAEIAKIESKALAYLPKDMSQVEKDLLVRQYVEREIL